MDAREKWVKAAEELADQMSFSDSCSLLYSGTKGVNYEVEFMTKRAQLFAHLRTTPEGYMLVKRCAQEDRSWPEDSSHENGDYFNTCISCERQFTGHKRRIVCKACAIPKAPPPKSEHL